MIGELLDVLSTDPEDARRRKLLNIVLLGVGVATLLLLLATVVATVLGLAGEPGEVAAIYLGGLAVLFGSVVIYAINRYGAGWLASSIFLVLLTMVIAFSDRPREVAEGRSLFLFTIPIIMASVLLPPYTSFILAGLSGLVVAVVGLRVQIVPNPGVVFGFFVIALVPWLSARSLGRALKDLRATNESLRESEEQYRELVEKASDIIYTHDLEGNFASVNPAATRIFGYTTEEALQLNIAQIVDAEYLPLARQKIREKLEGSPRTGPYELLTYSKEGKPIWVEVSTRLLEREGQPAEVLGIARNITERKRAEEALRQRAQELAALQATVLEIIAPHDLPSLLQTIVERAAGLLHAPGGGMYLCDPARQEVRCVVSYNTPRDYTGTTLKYGEGAAGVVAQTGEPLIIDDYHTWSGRAAVYEEEQPFRAVLSAPMIWQGQVTGVIHVLHYVEGRRFTEADLELLTLFANHAAIAVENARLFEEMERRATENTALLETSLALNSLDLDGTLRTIGERAKALFAADGCRVFLLEPDGETLRCALALHQRAEAVLAMRLKLGEGVTGDVAQRGEAEIINDMLGDPRSIQVPGTPVEQEVMMFSPLKERERVIGVMSVSRLGDERPFRPADLELLKAFASMASSTISNARLFQETRHRAAQLAIVNELGRALAATLDLPTVYRTASEHVRRLVDCPNFGISLFDPERQTITAAFMLCEGVEMDLSEFPPLHHKPQARTGRSKAIASGQPVIVYDHLHAFQESGQAYAIGNELEPLTALYVPMIVEGQAIGLLEVQSYRSQAYRQEDIELLTTAANQIGLAIQNARLFGETRRLQEFNQNIVQGVAEAILMEDAQGNLTFANPAAEELLGYAPGELIGQHWTTLVPEDEIKKVREELAKRPEGIAGRYETALLSKQGQRIPVIVSAQPLFENGEFVGVLSAFTDITERKRAEEELRESYAKLQQVLEGTVYVLISAIEMSDPYTAGHQRRVTRLACAIAEEMGLPQEQIEGLRMAGLIHDIGKITVPAEILSKPGPLSELEWGLIRAHAQVGYDVLNGAIEFPWPVAQIVLQHHERMDGSGYPQGLSGEEIMLEARILAVSDVVEAMASYRPYRPARGLDKALEEISQHRGALYDPEVVDACLKLFAEKGFKFEQGEEEAWVTEPAS